MKFVSAYIWILCNWCVNYVVNDDK